MDSSILNINQSSAELSKIYTEDYYYYLRSQAFCEAFLQPLGECINDLGFPCLDVGCGEGQLAEFVEVPYHGIDGSRVAIETAKTVLEKPTRTFQVARLENYPLETRERFGTIVFGGILSVLINPEKRVDLLRLYQRLKPEFFIVYDLEILETEQLDEEFKLVEEYHATANIDLQDVKRHRKILVYQCS